MNPEDHKHPTTPLPPITLVPERDAELAKVNAELDEINRRIALIAAQVRWIQRAGREDRYAKRQPA